MITTQMGDCLRTGKPTRYITDFKVNSAFRPSGVGKASTGLFGWGKCGEVAFDCDEWQVTARSDMAGYAS